MLQKMAVLPLILYIRIKGEDLRGGYMKFTGDRLWRRRREKAKQGGVESLGLDEK